MWVGHLFSFLLMTPRVCCAFLATELHCAVQLFQIFGVGFLEANVIVKHLVGLNFISQVFCHSSSLITPRVVVDHFGGEKCHCLI